MPGRESRSLARPNAGGVTCDPVQVGAPTEDTATGELLTAADTSGSPNTNISPHP